LWIQLRYPKRETFSRERRRNAQTAQCMQASNSSSQWAQIHGHLFPSTNILFNMPRVHLVSTIWVLGCTMGNFYVSISIRVWILKVQTYFTNLQVFKKCNEFLLVTVKCISMRCHNVMHVIFPCHFHVCWAINFHWKFYVSDFMYGNAVWHSMAAGCRFIVSYCFFRNRAKFHF